MPKPCGRKVSVAAARAGSMRPVWRCMCVPAPKQGVPYSGMHCYLSWSGEKSFWGWILEPTASTWFWIVETRGKAFLWRFAAHDRWTSRMYRNFWKMSAVTGWCDGFQIPKHEEEMALCGKLLIHLALGRVDCFTYKGETPKTFASPPAVALWPNLLDYGNAALDTMVKSTRFYSFHKYWSAHYVPGTVPRPQGLPILGVHVGSR